MATGSVILSQETIDMYQHHFEKWEKSNLNQSEYCVLNNLKYHTFAYLRSKLRRKKKQANASSVKKVKFIELKAEHKIETLSDNQDKVKIFYKDIEINCHISVSSQILKSIISTFGDN